MLICIYIIWSLQFATVKAEEISGCKPAEVANLGKLLDDSLIDYDHELGFIQRELNCH